MGQLDFKFNPFISIDLHAFVRQTENLQRGIN